MKKYVQCVSNNNKVDSPKETIVAIKEAGFDSVFVQWYNKDWEFSQQEQVDYCKELNLNIEFAHLGFKNINCIWNEGEEGDLYIKSFLNDFDKCIENGINLVVLHLTCGTIAPKPSIVGIKRIQKLADYAQKIGLRIAFENTKIFGYLEYVFDHIKNDNIGVCYDAGHDHCHFNDKFNWNRFKGKIFAVHLHDNDSTDDQHLLPFDGNINWKNITAKLKTAGYNGPVTLESCYRNQYLDMNVKDFFKLSFERAKKLEL